MPLKTFTLRERPDREDEFDRLAEADSPRFLRQRDELGVGQHWPALFTTFADYQLILFDGDRVAGIGHTVPFVWDGTPAGLPDSLAEVLGNAVRARKASIRPTALAALGAVTTGQEGRGHRRALVQAMTAVARERGGGALVAPVRPFDKARYPLAPIERYVAWTHPDGAPVDPWIRTHWRLGAEVVRVTPRALVITGSVAQWEEWTELVFPDTGPYVVPGALRPVIIDRERDEGRYEDPAVWMRHPPP